MQFVRRRGSVRESSEKQKKELKKTLDTAGVVRDVALTRTLRYDSCQIESSIRYVKDMGGAPQHDHIHYYS